MQIIIQIFWQWNSNVEPKLTIDSPSVQFILLVMHTACKKLMPNSCYSTAVAGFKVLGFFNLDLSVIILLPMSPMSVPTPTHFLHFQSIKSLYCGRKTKKNSVLKISLSRPIYIKLHKRTKSIRRQNLTKFFIRIALKWP